MSKSQETEDPLLERLTNSPRKSTLNNVLKKRKPQRRKTMDQTPYNQEHQDHTSSNHPNNPTFSNDLDVNRVILFLIAYLSIGSLCFFFVSDQIKGEKTNSILDAIYLCIVTMTTVGYGDLVPDSFAAKFLACVFVFTGMALVGFFLSKAADIIVQKQQLLLFKTIHMREKFTPFEILKEAETNKAKYGFFITLFLLVILLLTGTVFLNQNEGLDLFDAFYCVCATVTTLGYGDKSFTTYGGRVFASFWILISTICLAQFFYYIAELYTEQRRERLVRWVVTRKLTMSDLEAADFDHDNVVSAAEFIIYKLKEMEKISDHDIAIVMEGFKHVDKDQSGTLTEADLL